MDSHDYSSLTLERFLNGNNSVEDEATAEYILNKIRKSSVQEILMIIRDSKCPRQTITSGNIPQFSRFFDYEKVLRIVMDSGEENIPFQLLGYYLEGKKSQLAMCKYGENHYKLASQIGLVTSGKHHEATFLGKAYRKIEDEAIRHMIGCKLCLRIPVIWQLIFRACIGPVDLTEFLQQYLSLSTAKRRKSNVRKILNYLQGYDIESRKYIYENVR